MQSLDEPILREVQRPNQPWLWAIVVVASGVMWWAFIVQIAQGRAFGANPAPDWVLWLMMALIGLALPAMMLFVRLIVEVWPDRIVIRFVPFCRRTIDVERITECRPRQYRPIREYLGWGIRRGLSGIAYTMSGNQGVQLVIDEGRRVLIGSRRAEELAKAIESVRQV